MTPLLIIGAGGFGKAVADAALAQGRWRLKGFVDDRYPALDHVAGWPVLGRMDALPTLTAQAHHVALALGDNALRARFADLASAAGFELASVVHPRAWVSPQAQLAPGCIVMAGALISAGVSVGRLAIINAGAVLDHDVQVGDGARLGVGCCLGGGAQVEAGAWLREGAVLQARDVLRQSESAP